MTSSPPPNQAKSLRQITATGDYLVRAGEVVQAVSTARTRAEAIALLNEATARMGADTSAFVSFARDEESCASYWFLLACDPLWCVEYEAGGHFMADPWLAYAFEHSEPVCGSAIAAKTDAQRSALELASRFGFKSAVIVPAPSSGGLSRRGMLCLGSNTPGFFEADGFSALKVVARSLAMEIHEWWIGQVRKELLGRVRLTEKDLLLLMHEKQGHSSKVMARELSMSVSAIDCRFHRVNAKLGVANRRAAARRAAEYGLI